MPTNRPYLRSCFPLVTKHICMLFRPPWSPSMVLGRLYVRPQQGTVLHSAACGFRWHTMSRHRCCRTWRPPLPNGRTLAQGLVPGHCSLVLAPRGVWSSSLCVSTSVCLHFVLNPIKESNLHRSSRPRSTGPSFTALLSF